LAGPDLPYRGFAAAVAVTPISVTTDDATSTTAITRTPTIVTTTDCTAASHTTASKATSATYAAISMHGVLRLADAIHASAKPAMRRLGAFGGSGDPMPSQAALACSALL
jgi:hypothetical protein